MSETATAGPVASGRLDEQKDGAIVLAVPGTDYRLHLAVDAALPAAAGSRVRGTIRGVARRIDTMPSGGRFIEPVHGRPRRVQGRVIGTDPGAGTILVQAGVPISVQVGDPRQQASQFAVGDLVAFDVERGARFLPMT